MSTPSPIDQFIELFRRELTGVPWWRRRVIVAEIRGHLEDAAAEEQTRGTDRVEGEQCAVARFGDPAAVAAGIRSEHRPLRWPVAVAGIAAALVVGLGVLQVTAGKHTTVVHVREVARTRSTLMKQAMAARAEAQRLHDMNLARTSPPLDELTRPPVLIGGTSAQRVVIASLAAQIPMPGTARILIENRRHFPSGITRGTLELQTPHTRPNNPRRGWASAASDWAGSLLARGYTQVAKRDHLPTIGAVLVSSMGTKDWDVIPPGPVRVPDQPDTLARLRTQVEKEAQAQQLQVVRVAVVSIDGPNAYIEVRTSDPRRASRLQFGRPDGGGLASSLVLVDNPCGTPIAALGALPGIGTAWFDPAWYPPGFGSGFGSLSGGPQRPLLPANPCF